MTSQRAYNWLATPFPTPSQRAYNADLFLATAYQLPSPAHPIPHTRMRCLLAAPHRAQEGSNYDQSRHLQEETDR
jgi:hypothetical protein